jgi:hypothetical protein
LGHIVSPAGIQTDPNKLEAVHEWPRPKDKHQLRSFLGLCTYYRRFVKGCTDIAKPLHKLTEDKTPFIWDEESETAFRSLKISLCTSPLLSYPKMKGQYILDTDASNNGIGAVLDYFSKWPETYGLPNQEAVTVSRALMENWICRYGLRLEMHSDQGRNFE